MAIATLEQNWVTNPNTKKLVKIGSQTHRRLINEGVIKNTKLDEKILATYDPEKDDIDELKKQLKNSMLLKDNEIINVGRGRYKNKLIRGYKGNKGRPANKNNLSNLDQYINSILTAPIDRSDAFSSLCEPKVRTSDEVSSYSESESESESE